MTASDDDLIRRGDALTLCNQYPYVEGIEVALNELPAEQVTAYLENDVAELVEAAESALRFIENTESELGVILGCGDKVRAALARVKGGE